MLPAALVSNYLLARSDEDEGDLISNLMLQKLLYYSQGLFLAVHERELFKERIEAWMHGPVVPDEYHRIKSYGSGPIPRPQEIDFSLYNPEEREIMDEVWNVYGQFSAWRLAQMTHDERPWVETPLGSVISIELMREYFKSQLIPAS